MTNAAFVAALAWCAALLLLAVRDGLEWHRARQSALRDNWLPAAAVRNRAPGLVLMTGIVCLVPFALRVYELNVALAAVPRSAAKIAIHLVVRLELLKALLRELELLLPAGLIAASVWAFVQGERRILCRAAERAESRGAWRAAERRLALLPVGAAAIGAGVLHFVHVARGNVRAWDNHEPRQELVTQLAGAGERAAALGGASWIALAALMLGGGLAGWALWSDLTKARSGTLGLVSGIALAVTGIANVHAQRLARENATPVPTEYAFVNASLGFAPALSLAGTGPDRQEEGPDLRLVGRKLLLDNVELEGGGLLEALRFRIAHGPSDRVVNLTLTADLHPSALREHLAVVAAVRFARANLALSATYRRTSPIFGTLVGVSHTAIAVTLAKSSRECKPGTSPHSLIPLTDSSIEPLVQRLLDARRRGERPCLVVGRSTCPEATAGSDCWKRLEDSVRIERRVEVSGVGEALRFSVGGAGYDAFVVEEPELIRLHDGEGKTLDQVRRELETEGRTPLMLMNGGMYRPGYEAVGLLVVRGEEHMPLETALGKGNFYLQPNGVFAVTGVEGLSRKPSGASAITAVADQVRIEETSTDGYLYFLHATQSGPLLLQRGRLHPKVDPHSKHRAIRNGVGVQHARAAVFVISRAPVTFHQLATALTQLGCADGLYLDGNVSRAWLPALGVNADESRFGPIVSVSRPRVAL